MKATCVFVWLWEVAVPHWQGQKSARMVSPFISLTVTSDGCDLEAYIMDSDFES
jgi:hypothetical protein